MENLIRFFDNREPVTGKDLILETGIDIFNAWKACSSTKQIFTHLIGKRYLRLDRKVEGYARLSPSIMREYLNFTIIGLDRQKVSIKKIAADTEKEIASISKRKIALARDTINRLVESHPDGPVINSNVIFFIAGDVVFNMAHAEPRPEFSTGELVRGSDLDIIAVTSGLPDSLVRSLDNMIYKEKYNILMNPAIKEEIDYVIKDLAVVEKQFRFNNFKAMVASKILNEGLYLSGDRHLYDQIKQMLVEHEIPEKIGLLEEKAQRNRRTAEMCLLSACDTADRNELMALFYTTEEKEEIF